MLLRGNRLGKEIRPIDIGRAEAADVGQDHVGKASGRFGIAQLLGNEIVEGAKNVGFVDMVAAGGHGVAADEVHQAGKRGRVDIHTEPVLHLEEQGGKGVGRRHGVDWGYLKNLVFIISAIIRPFFIRKVGYVLYRITQHRLPG